jgi:hypothetical protein
MPPPATPTSDGELLYHYTSEEGLIGIIEYDNIRATHVRFLNDYTEFRQAFKEEYVEALTDAFREGLPEDLDTTARKVVEGMLSSRNRLSILEIIEDPTHEVFVCSFTSSNLSGGDDPGDRLSQWRGYSQASQGFSMGFDRTPLEKQIQFDRPRAKAGLVECIYVDKEKAQFFQAMGRKAAARFMDLTRSNEPVPGTFHTAMPDATKEYTKGNYHFLKSLSEATAEFQRPRRGSSIAGSVRSASGGSCFKAVEMRCRRLSSFGKDNSDRHHL